MLGFFRKIRFKSLSDGSLGKYFRYAIGEIILVVTGILIALQINNWNQDRLEMIKSGQFHSRLVEDLNQIIYALEQDVQRSKQVFESIKKSVKILEQGELTDDAKSILDFTLTNYYQFVPLGPELPSIEEMKSTGQLGLIYNQDLRKGINLYLKYLGAISRIFYKLSNEVAEADFMDEYIRVDLENSKSGSEKKILYDFERMSKDELFINKLSKFGSYWQEKENFSSKLMNATIRLRDKVTEEVSARFSKSNES